MIVRVRDLIEQCIQNMRKKENKKQKKATAIGQNSIKFDMDNGRFQLSNLDWCAWVWLMKQLVCKEISLHSALVWPLSQTRNRKYTLLLFRDVFFSYLKLVYPLLVPHEIDRLLKQSAHTGWKRKIINNTFTLHMK